MSEVSRFIESTPRGRYIRFGDLRVPITEAFEVEPLSWLLARAVDRYKNTFPEIPFPHVEPVGLVQAFSVKEETKTPTPERRGEALNEAVLTLIPRFLIHSSHNKSPDTPYGLLKGTLFKAPEVRTAARALLGVLTSILPVRQTMETIMQAAVEGKPEVLAQTYEIIRAGSRRDFPSYSQLEQLPYTSSLPKAILSAATYAEANPPHEVRFYLAPHVLVAVLSLPLKSVTDPLAALGPIFSGALGTILLPEIILHEAGHLLVKTERDAQGNIILHGLEHLPHETSSL